MNRREVLEYLVQVCGVRGARRLRRLTREYLRYQRRRGYEWIACCERGRKGTQPS